MFKRYAVIVASMTLFSAIFSGCPMQGASIVGAWAINLDADCDSMDVQHFILVIQKDNTAELLMEFDAEGTWTFNGTTVSLSFPDVQGAEYEFTGVLGSQTITSGTFTVDSMGTNCWTAEQLVS